MTLLLTGLNGHTYDKLADKTVKADAPRHRHEWQLILSQEMPLTAKQRCIGFQWLYAEFKHLTMAVQMSSIFLYVTINSTHSRGALLQTIPSIPWHSQSLQVEDCGSNSRLVVAENE